MGDRWSQRRAVDQHSNAVSRMRCSPASRQIDMQGDQLLTATKQAIVKRTVGCARHHWCRRCLRIANHGERNRSHVGNPARV